jgi:hypothetical protein
MGLRQCRSLELLGSPVVGNLDIIFSGWNPTLHITQHPFPVCISAVLIAILNHLLHKKHYFGQIRECTLGQRLVEDNPHLQPPLQPWENT